MIVQVTYRLYASELPNKRYDPRNEGIAEYINLVFARMESYFPRYYPQLWRKNKILGELSIFYQLDLANPRLFCEEIKYALREF